MSNPLLEVLLKDERDWPWEQKAREELNDIPHLRAEKLETFKTKIRLYAEANPGFRPKTDDDTLMAFLRTRKFNIDRAMDSYTNFFKIRQCNPKKIFPVGRGPKDYRRVYDKPLGLAMPQRNPIDGTAITYGVRFILDFTGMNVALLGLFLTSIYYSKALLRALGSFPVRFKGLHAVNNPLWGTQTLYKLFRPFLSKKLKERVHFHGDRLEELHRFVPPTVLPDIFGGTAGAFDASWLSEHVYGMHDEIVSDSYYGWN